MVTLKISRVVDSALRWQWLLLVTTIFVVWLNQPPSWPLIKRLKRPTDAWAFGSAVRALHIVLVASNLPKLGILKYEHYILCFVAPPGATICIASESLAWVRFLSCAQHKNSQAESREEPIADLAFTLT